MRDVETTELGGVNVAVLGCADTAELMVERSFARRGMGGPCEYHTAVNGQVVAELNGSKTLQEAFQVAAVVSADSMPMVFASRIFGRAALPGRVCTTDLFVDVAERAERRGVSFYLLGGTEPTNKAVADFLAREYPALRVVGRRDGYFGDAQEAEVVAAINAAAPDILWVGMGIPKQEAFALMNREKLENVGVLKTCGGCFRYFGGELRRAPQWIQQAGLEWAYLASLDPRGRLMRYVLTNPQAIYRVVAGSRMRLPAPIRRNA